MRVSGLPLLLAGALLVVYAAVALLVRDQLDTLEAAAAFTLLGAGLVMLGSWSAIEIRAARRTRASAAPEELPDQDRAS